MSGNYLQDRGLDPIVQDHAPTGQDYAGYGTIWIDQSLDDIYVAADTVNGLMVWVPCGGGSGLFSSLNVSGASIFGGAITASTFTAGVVVSSAVGVLSSSAGTDGQVIIGATGAAPAWAALTAGAGINITTGANSIQIDATGATAVKYTTDDANVVVPDGVGNINVVGGSNLTSTGAIANTITIDLDSTIAVTGKITAGNDFEMTLGTCLINSDDNAAQAIYLHANGGVNETIDIYSQLGTSATSLNLHSAVGGITIAAGTALALTGTASSSITMTNAAFAIATGTGALNLGTDAAAKTVTLGSTTGAASTVVQCGTGALNITGGGAMTLSAAGLLKIDSSAGRIDIGTDVVAQNINIGTSAAARTITIGNSTGASSVIVDCGTGNFDLGVTATDHTSRLGSTTGVSALTLQTGTGAMTFTAGGVFDVNATGNVTIDSTGGTIGIGEGADAHNINIGTGAAARVITIGNNTTTTALQLTSGTGDITLTSADAVVVDAVGVVELNSSGAAIGIGNDADAFNINIGTGAAARTITVGNNTTTTAVNITAGSGEISCNTDVNLTTAGTGFVLQEGPKVIAGSGSPSGSITAPKGSLYLRTDGTTTNDRAYINTDSGTMWTALTTAA